MIAFAAAALAQTCDGPPLTAPGEALSVAWVSPLRSHAGANEWLVVVPTAELRAYATGGATVGRTLQRLGLRKRPTDPHRRYKVVVFDAARTSLCRPLAAGPPGAVVAEVVTCDERRSRERAGYDGCGWLEDVTGEASFAAYRARWSDLAGNGFCVLPMDRFVTTPARPVLGRAP